MSTAKWNHPVRTSIAPGTSVLEAAADRNNAPALVSNEGRGLGKEPGLGEPGFSEHGFSEHGFGLDCWCLPSGQGLTEFALQAGFLARQSMLPRWWQATGDEPGPPQSAGGRQAGRGIPTSAQRPRAAA